MDEECIHGFGRGDCAACYPPPVVEVVAPVKKARASGPRSTSLREPAGAAGSTASAKTVKKPLVPVADRRIYHVTHIGNLPGIVERGVVSADAAEDAAEAVRVFSAQAIADRGATAVPGRDADVAAHVPFALTPNSSVWESIRGGIDDPRLDATAAGAAASEFVILVSTVRLAFAAQAASDGAPDAGVVVADGYAAAPLTRFATSPAEVERMLHLIGDDEEPSALLEAELLVPGEFPFESVTLIGVANDRVRDEVRRIHHAASHTPKIAVYPPWFQSAQEVRY